MKSIIFMVVSLCCPSLLFGQETIIIRDAIKKEKIVWYGLDFSKARLLGNFDDKYGIYNAYLDIWNDLIIKGFMDNTGEGYLSIKKILKKKDLIVDLEPITKNNRSININELFALDASPRPIFDPPLIQKVIDGYSLKEGEGLGLVLIIENYNKYTESVCGHVTIFSMKNKMVLYSKSLTGKAFGIGMDKHWAAGLINLLEDWSYIAGYSKDNSLLKKKKPDSIKY